MEESEPQNVPLHASTTTGVTASGENRMFVEVQRADTKATALSARTRRRSIGSVQYPLGPLI
ncbi:hypothetical protein ACIQHU_02640 [Streptomyces tendae]|uniref:hypothetical protein n=1 Tax=Streptomyces tendae TaxID=1932 RepID=UPI0037F43C8F